MELEKQVVSIELAKRLKELGVAQQQSIFSYHSYHYKGETLWKLCDRREISWNESIDAFTAAELGEMLPVAIKPSKDMEVSSLRIETYGEPKKWRIQYMRLDDVGAYVTDREPLNPATDTNEADARAKMLIHLIEIGIVKP